MRPNGSRLVILALAMTWTVPLAAKPPGTRYAKAPLSKAKVVSVPKAEGGYALGLMFRPDPKLPDSQLMVIDGGKVILAANGVDVMPFENWFKEFTGNYITGMAKGRTFSAVEVTWCANYKTDCAPCQYGFKVKEGCEKAYLFCGQGRCSLFNEKGEPLGVRQD